MGLGDSLIGGLLGRAAGAMLGGAMRQLQNQQEQVHPLQAVLREKLCCYRQHTATVHFGHGWMHSGGTEIGMGRAMFLNTPSRS